MCIPLNRDKNVNEYWTIDANFGFQIRLKKKCYFVLSSHPEVKVMNQAFPSLLKRNEGIFLFQKFSLPNFSAKAAASTRRSRF